MLSCLNTEINRLAQICQQANREVPEPNDMEKCIGATAILALESYACFQIMSNPPSCCCLCILPAFLLDYEVLNPIIFTSNEGNPLGVSMGRKNVFGGIKKDECCKIAKVSSLALKKYAKEKYEPALIAPASSLIAREDRV